MSNQELEKKTAALRALDYIENGMIIGLGTGSTSKYMIEGLSKRVTEGLSIKGVPSSEQTAELARSLNIPLTTLEEEPEIDVTIDGADEFDSQKRLIKGGGGALLREKIIGYNSKQNIIIADSSKQCEKLGAFRLPIEMIPFASATIIRKLQQLHIDPQLRKQNETPYRTDENNFILDTDIHSYNDLEELNQTLLSIPGIVETGLFLDTTTRILVGKQGKVEIIE